jgi:hypothetical protein
MTQPADPAAAPGPAPAPQVVLGEVHTGLLVHHSALRRDEAEGLLAALAPGEQVLGWERPIAHALSAPVVLGLDCALALGAEGGRTARAVGTVSSRAALTGGTILQCTTTAAVPAAGCGRRAPWSHYTARPGVLETFAAQPPDQLAEGFLGEGGQRPGTADFGAVCERLVRRLQNSTALKGSAPLLFHRTRLRWAVTVAPSNPARALLRLGEGENRTLRAEAADSDPGEIAEFCGDLALHDWILTTVIRILDGHTGAKPEQDLAEIRTIVGRLLHLWMPAARVNAELAALWSEFERTPGFTRQWRSLVARMRDQISLHTAQRLGVLINHDEQCA